MKNYKPLKRVKLKFGEKRELTQIGRQLAQLPIDPRLGRMVIEAAKNGSLHEVMMIVSALSIQDPRERPQEKHKPRMKNIAALQIKILIF